MRYRAPARSPGRGGLQREPQEGPDPEGGHEPLDPAREPHGRRHEPADGAPALFRAHGRPHGPDAVPDRAHGRVDRGVRGAVHTPAEAGEAPVAPAPADRAARLKQ